MAARKAEDSLIAACGQTMGRLTKEAEARITEKVGAESVRLQVRIATLEGQLEVLATMLEAAIKGRGR